MALVIYFKPSPSLAGPSRARALTVNIVTVMFVVCLFYFHFQVADCKRSYKFYFPDPHVCGQYGREIDGAVLISSSNALYADSSCVVKLKADGNAMMLNFEHWYVTDCSVRLRIYFTSSSYLYDINAPNAKYDCNTTHPPALASPYSKYVVLRLDKRTVTGYSFRIVLTAYKHKTYCSKHRCANSVCIDRDLRCDGVRNCLDGSDERFCVHHGMRRSGRIGLGFSSVIFIAIVVLAIWCYHRRRRRYQQGLVLQPAAVVTTATDRNPTTFPMQPAPYQANPPVQPSYPPGQAAYPAGPMPYPTGQAPYATGQAPYATGQAPYPTGPYTTGQASYPPGNFKATAYPNEAPPPYPGNN